MITNFLFCSVFQVISVCPFFRNYPNKPLMDKWNLNIFSPQSSNRDSVGVAPRRLLQSNAINCLNEVLFVKAGLGMFVMFSLPSHSRPYPRLSLSRPFRDPILLLTDSLFFPCPDLKVRTGWLSLPYQDYFRPWRRPTPSLRLSQMSTTGPLAAAQLKL